MSSTIRRPSRSVRLALVSLVLACASATVARGKVASPTLEGPVTGGRGVPLLATTTFDLAQVGYAQTEYFISGTATAYTNDGDLASDGRWVVTPGATAAYRTRVLVYRPANPKNFKGTVVVEWLNVSSGFDAAPDWLGAHAELIRKGFAWMGVSAQIVGVEGGTAVVPGIPPLPLKKTDPGRYGSLVHPGDSFSYDIFSQAGQAIRHPAGTSPLGDLKVRKIIADGESQSAYRMVTYINGIHPVARIYDGFLVHSRGASAAPLSEAPQPKIPAPLRALIRTDLRVPVLTFETETDLGLLAYFSDRQPDGKRFRLWEVAGTAHVDAYTLVVGPADTGTSPAAAELTVTSSPVPPFIRCGAPVNSGPQHFVLNAALEALDRWVRHGKPPPRAPRLEIAPGPPVTIMRDAYGNALGGIRTPQVDVPIATLSGQGQTGTILCVLFGTTVPFDAATLASLYPSHDAYVSAFDDAAKRARRAGFLLKPDVELMERVAASSSIGN